MTDNPIDICWNCNESLYHHTETKTDRCLKEINEKLSLFFEMFDLQEIESEVDSFQTDTSDSDVQGDEQYE